MRNNDRKIKKHKELCSYPEHALSHKEKRQKKQIEKEYGDEEITDEDVARMKPSTRRHL